MYKLTQEKNTQQEYYSIGDTKCLELHYTGRIEYSWEVLMSTEEEFELEVASLADAELLKLIEMLSNDLRVATSPCRANLSAYPGAIGERLQV